MPQPFESRAHRPSPPRHVAACHVEASLSAVQERLLAPHACLRRDSARGTAPTRRRVPTHDWLALTVVGLFCLELALVAPAARAAALRVSAEAAPLGERLRPASVVRTARPMLHEPTLTG